MCNVYKLNYPFTLQWREQKSQGITINGSLFCHGIGLCKIFSSTYIVKKVISPTTLFDIKREFFFDFTGTYAVNPNACLHMINESDCSSIALL
jgi:hypothetical protein